jgi:rubrerythrin
MDIFDYAMQLEKDGEAYYREAASRSANKGLTQILTMLADAEVEHYNVFSRMKADEHTRYAETPILRNVKNIFVTMRDEGDLEGIGVSELEVYRKAQEIEKKTEDFYLEKAARVKGAQRETFLQVAGEENKHYFILQQIIDFVSRPNHWLENAEWYHLDEY